MFRLRKIFSDTSLVIKNFVRHNTKTSFDKNRYVIVRVTPKDYLDVMKLFWTSFTSDEPAFVSSGLSKKYNPMIEEMVMHALCQGYSLMVKCRSSGKIIGASINGSTTCWDPDVRDKVASTCLCENTRNLLKFFSHVSRSPKLFEKYCQHVIFECMYVMVRRLDRGQGLARSLLTNSREYSRDMGFSVMRVDCTSELMSRCCEKIGLRKEWEMPYSAYKTQEGQQIFYPPPPHKVVRVYIDFPKLLSKHCKNLEDN